MTFADEFSAHVREMGISMARVIAGNQNADLDPLTRCAWCGKVTEDQPSEERPHDPWRGLCREHQAESLGESREDFAPDDRHDVDVEDPDDEC